MNKLLTALSVFAVFALLLTFGMPSLLAPATAQDAPARRQAQQGERGQAQQGERGQNQRRGGPGGFLGGVDQAVAVLHPTEGNQAHGVVRFRRDGEQIRVTARIEGLTPNSAHGFHVHEFGDCTAPDATSAGGHYNPEGHDHALPNGGPRHAGDLGNLQANADGVAELELTVDNITLAGRRNPVLGRAVIVHAKPDTGAQPTGDAGGRIACGVIGIANPGQ